MLWLGSPQGIKKKKLLSSMITSEEIKKGTAEEVCLSEPLGSGSCSTVYKAEVPHRRQGSTVAVKVFSSEKADLARHEFDILQRARHPGCVTPIALQHSTNGEVYLLMELVKGPDMIGLLQRSHRGVVSERSAQLLTRRILETLQYLHDEAQIVHMDVKLENLIVIPETLEVKLIDFHLARRYDERRGKRSQPDPSDITRSPDRVHAYSPRQCQLTADEGNSPCCNQEREANRNAICHCEETAIHATHHHHDVPCDEHDSCQPFHCSPCGSLKYAPPEVIAHILQHEGPRLVTWQELQKVDIFALGVVVYGILTGKFPFQGIGKKGLLEQMRCGPRLRSPFFDKCSRECLGFLRSLMCPDVAKRPTAERALHLPWMLMLDIKAPPRPLFLESNFCSSNLSETLPWSHSALGITQPLRSELSSGCCSSQGTTEGEVELGRVVKTYPMEVRKSLAEECDGAASEMECRCGSCAVS